MNTTVTDDLVIFEFVYIILILHILRILHISRILHILHIFDNLKLFVTECLDTCQSTIVYECQESEEVLYVVHVSSTLGRLRLVPVGSTGTIPFEMRRELADFPGAVCDKSKDAEKGCRWCYVDRFALSWGTKQ